MHPIAVFTTCILKLEREGGSDARYLSKGIWQLNVVIAYEHKLTYESNASINSIIFMIQLIRKTIAHNQRRKQKNT